MNEYEDFFYALFTEKCSTNLCNQSRDDYDSSFAVKKTNDRLMHLISMLYMSLVLVVGLLGNSIATFIFLFSPLWRRNPTTKYLMALAFADNLVIISMSLPLLQVVRIPLPYFSYMCHVNVYAFYVGIALTGYYCKSSTIWQKETATHDLLL